MYFTLVLAFKYDRVLATEHLPNSVMETRSGPKSQQSLDPYPKALAVLGVGFLFKPILAGIFIY